MNKLCLILGPLRLKNLLRKLDSKPAAVAHAVIDEEVETPLNWAGSYHRYILLKSPTFKCYRVCKKTQFLFNMNTLYLLTHSDFGRILRNDSRNFCIKKSEFFKENWHNLYWNVFIKQTYKNLPEKLNNFPSISSMPLSLFWCFRLIWSILIKNWVITKSRLELIYGNIIQVWNGIS